MAETDRPILVGEANPYGGDPEFALYPAPDGCSGHRLCCLVLGMHRAEYLRAFERVNLCPHEWDAAQARDTVAALLRRTEGCRFVLLGSRVCHSFSVRYDPLSRPRVKRSRHTALVLPHPSGLCRAWNEPGYFLKARAAVLEFAPELKSALGAYYDHSGG